MNGIDVTNTVSAPLLLALGTALGGGAVKLYLAWTAYREARDRAEVDGQRVDRVEAVKAEAERDASAAADYRQLFHDERARSQQDRATWLQELARQQEAWAAERERMVQEHDHSVELLEDRLALVEEKVLQLQALNESRNEDLESAYAELGRRDKTIAEKDERIGERDAELRRASGHIHRLRAARAVLEAELRRHGLDVPNVQGDLNDGADLAPERRTVTVPADAVTVTTEEHDP